MNTNTINKDNVGSTILLAAMILTIAAAIFGSVNAHAKSSGSAAAVAEATAVTMPKARSTKITTDAFVITATRLK
jgi:hypothetical protein